MHYRADIDGLRAIAVLGVVLFHFGVGSLPGGFVGVDIFFVISGYLITKLIVEDVERGQFSFRRFYIRRIRRLFPALIFTVTCSLLAAFFLFSPEQMTRLGTSIAAAVFSVSNVLFWSESGYFDASSHVKPLLHTWSLSVEEQFYLIWPFLLVWLMRFGRKAVIAALVVLFAVSLGGNVAAEEYRSALFYLSPFRFFEFALGAILVFIPPARSNSLMEFSLALGLALICFAYLYFTEATLFPSYPALVPVFGACLAIYGGRALWTGYLLRNGVAAGIGLISYSLYLAHWPLLVFWQYVRIEQIGRNERVALLALTFAVALFMYRFIERPFRMRNGSGFSLFPKSFMGGAIVCAILISAGGIHASATHGWLWRLGAKDRLLREFVAGDRVVDAAYGGDGCAAPCSTSDDDRAPDIIVIGDSHSRQYYLGAKVSLPDLKIDFYEYSSCQFYSVEYTRDFTGYADPIIYDRGCRVAREKSFRCDPKDAWRIGDRGRVLGSCTHALGTGWCHAACVNARCIL